MPKGRGFSPPYGDFQCFWRIGLWFYSTLEYRYLMRRGSYDVLPEETVNFSYQFKDNSAAVLRALESAQTNGLTEIGKSVVAHARERVPVDTGALRDSITATVDGDTLTVGSNKEYALPVETGTSKMAARPYLKPAMTEYGEEYERTMRDALENA